MDWETVYQSMPSQDLDDMGKAELLEVQWQVRGWYSLDTTVYVKPWPPQPERSELCEILRPGTMVNETYQATNGHPTSS